MSGEPGKWMQIDNAPSRKKPIGQAGPTPKRISLRDRVRDLEQRLARAEDEAEQLRAGESEKPADEGVQLTPPEWIHRWNRLTREQRLTMVESMYAFFDDLFVCYRDDHSGRLVHAEQQATQLHPALLNLSRCYDLLREAETALEQLGACNDPGCETPDCAHVLPQIGSALAGEPPAGPSERLVDVEAALTSVRELAQRWVNNVGEGPSNEDRFAADMLALAGKYVLGALEPG